MRAARLIAVWLGVLALVPAAGTASVARTAVPTGLHAFLLRADEPVVHSFPRTPSFAWNPVRGAVRYQFQLSTSSAFRENGIVYSANGLSTPVVAPTSTLPWTSNNLYARVRAIFRASASPWSAPFTFDMTPPAAPSPEPLPSAGAGLLRWTPVEGADAYEAWLIDIPKREVVFTNVLDEREFYTFHRDSKWTGTVRWRIRALRIDNDPQGFMFDSTPVQTTESMAPASPTTSVPSDSDTSSAGAGTSSSSSSPSSPSSAPAQINLQGNLGAPVDLWDTDWPNGGYYWTVVAVEAHSPGELTTNVGVPGSAVGAMAIPVPGAFELAAGDKILIGTIGNQEAATVTSTTATTVTIAAPLKFAHGPGEPVVRTGGNLQYRDLELPQDVCALGRVMRFGKDSEPSLTSAGELFASGLSSNGRLVSAPLTSKFYGN